MDDVIGTSDAFDSFAAEAAGSCCSHRVLAPYDGGAPKGAETKRFFERWLADEGFRARLLTASPSSGTADIADELRILWDHSYQTVLGRLALSDVVAAVPAGGLRLLEWINSNQAYRDRLRRSSEPVDPGFAAWRARQIGRSRTEFRQAYDLNTPHITFAIELADGCSVGCWFCGVSAPRLAASFPQTKENADLFRRVLVALSTVTGLTAGRHGFLYWATDPFDNPDYERFCLDFKTCFGAFPITTTAMALRDLARTRAFLEFAETHGAEKIRFSVSTLRQMDDLHRAFTPIELRNVDVLPFNKGSLLQPSPSGRARHRSRRPTPDVEEVLSRQKRDETISCVSGFLVNMVRRTIKLISPCNSCDAWPLGYYIYDEALFAPNDDILAILRDMIDRHMPAVIAADRIVRFRHDLAYQRLPDGFRVTTAHGGHTYSGNPLMPDVSDAIDKGCSTAEQIAADFGSWYPGGRSVASSWIAAFFKAGILDEAPELR